MKSTVVDIQSGHGGGNFVINSTGVYYYYEMITSQQSLHCVSNMWLAG